MGVSPAVTRIHYSDADYYMLELSFSNNAPGYIDLEIVDGPLAQYARLDINELYVAPGERAKVEAIVELPGDLELYGVQSIRVMGRLRPPEGEGVIAVTTAIISRLEITFPYPDRYVELRNLQIGDVGEGSDATATWQVINLGNEQLQYTTTYTVRETGQETSIINEQMSVRGISAGETQEITQTLDTGNFAPGSYFVNVEIRFDDEVQSLNRRLRIGEKTVSVTNFNQEFRDERINQFNVGVRNEWNEELKNIRAELTIGEATARTDTVDLRGMSSASLQGFIDTTGLRIGTYNAKILLTFQDLDGETFEIEETRQVRIVSHVTGEYKSSNTTIIVLSALLVIFLIILLVLALSLLKKK